MILLSNKPLWVCPGGNQLNSEDFAKEAKSLIARGSNVYVGTDSMIRGENCIFVTVIAFHCNEGKIAKYYYKKFKITNKEYMNLKNKINEEVIYQFKPLKK